MISKGLWHWRQIILSHLDKDSARKMKLYIFLLCIFWIEAKEEALPGEFPWSVSLELDPQQGYFGHDCGGAILDEVFEITLKWFQNQKWNISIFQNWIITTAYCAQLNDELDHNNFLVIAGEFDTQAIDGSEQLKHVQQAFVHPYFSSEQGSDVGLLRLDSPLEFNEFVQVKSMV